MLSYKKFKKQAWACLYRSCFKARFFHPPAPFHGHPCQGGIWTNPENLNSISIRTVFLITACLLFSSCSLFKDEGPDTVNESSFIVEEIKTPDHRELFSEHTAENGLQNMFSLNLKACLRDAILEDSSIPAGHKFVVEYQTNLDKESIDDKNLKIKSIKQTGFFTQQEVKPLSRLTIVEEKSTNEQGCIQWKEYYKYEYYKQSTWIGLTRTIRHGAGNSYLGTMDIPIAVNPWFSTYEKEESDQGPIDYRYWQDEDFFANEEIYKSDGLGFLDSIRDSLKDKPILWAPELDLQIGESSKYYPSLEPLITACQLLTGELTENSQQISIGSFCSKIQTLKANQDFLSNIKIKDILFEKEQSEIDTEGQDINCKELIDILKNNTEEVRIINQEQGQKILSDCKEKFLEENQALWEEFEKICGHFINPTQTAVQEEPAKKFCLQVNHKDQYKACSSDNTDDICYYRNFNFTMRIPLEFKSLSSLLKNFDTELSGGKYNIQSYLIVSPKGHGNSSYLLGHPCSRTNISTDSDNELSVHCDFAITDFNSNSIFRLGLEIRLAGDQGVHFRSFSAVWTINFDPESGEKREYELDNQAFKDTTVRLKKNDNVVFSNEEDSEKPYINFLKSDDENLDILNPYLREDDKRSDRLSSDNLKLALDPDFKFANIESQENVVERIINFIGEIKISDPMNSYENLANKYFFVELTDLSQDNSDEDEGLQHKIFFKTDDFTTDTETNTKMDTGQEFKTNENSVLTIPISIRHKLYNRQRYFKVGLYVRSPELGIEGETTLALNPWQRAFQAFQPAEDLEPQHIRYEVDNVEKPELIINQFRSTNLFPSYGLDKLLNIHLFHRLYLLFQPFIRRPDNVSLGIDYKSRELLRDGEYLVRVLILRNPKETNTNGWQAVMSQYFLNREREKIVDIDSIINLTGAEYLTHTDSYITTKANFVNFYMPLHLSTSQFYYIASRNIIVIEIYPADPRCLKYDTEDRLTQESLWRAYKEHALTNRPYAGAFNIQNWTNWNILQPAKINTDQLIESSKIGKKYKHFSLSEPRITGDSIESDACPLQQVENEAIKTMDQAIQPVTNVSETTNECDLEPIGIQDFTPETQALGSKGINVSVYSATTMDQQENINQNCRTQEIDNFCDAHANQTDSAQAEICKENVARNSEKLAVITDSPESTNFQGASLPQKAQSARENLSSLSPALEKELNNIQNHSLCSTNDSQNKESCPEDLLKNYALENSLKVILIEEDDKFSQDLQNSYRNYLKDFFYKGLFSPIVPSDENHPQDTKQDEETIFDRLCFWCSKGNKEENKAQENQNSSYENPSHDLKSLLLLNQELRTVLQKHLEWINQQELFNGKSILKYALNPGYYWSFEWEDTFSNQDSNNSDRVRETEKQRDYIARNIYRGYLPLLDRCEDIGSIRSSRCVMLFISYVNMLKAYAESKDLLSALSQFIESHPHLWTQDIESCASRQDKKACQFQQLLLSLESWNPEGDFQQQVISSQIESSRGERPESLIQNNKLILNHTFRWMLSYLVYAISRDIPQWLKFYIAYGFNKKFLTSMIKASLQCPNSSTQNSLSSPENTIPNGQTPFLNQTPINDESCYIEEIKSFLVGEGINIVEDLQFYTDRTKKELENLDLNNSELFYQNRNFLGSKDKLTTQSLSRIIDQDVFESTSDQNYPVFSKAICRFWTDHFIKTYIPDEETLQVSTYMNYAKDFDYLRYLENNYVIGDDAEKNTKIIDRMKEYTVNIEDKIYKKDKEIDCHKEYKQCAKEHFCFYNFERYKDSSSSNANETNIAYDFVKINYCEEESSCSFMLQSYCEIQPEKSLCQDYNKEDKLSGSCPEEVNRFCITSPDSSLCAYNRTRCVEEYTKCLVGGEQNRECLKGEQNTQCLAENPLFDLKPEEILNKTEELINSCQKSFKNFFKIENKVIVHEISEHPGDLKFNRGFLRNFSVTYNNSIGSYMNWTAQRGRDLSLSVSPLEGLLKLIPLVKFGFSISQSQSSNESNSGRRAWDARGGDAVFLTIGQAELEITLKKYQKCLVIKPKTHAFFYDPNTDHKFKNVWKTNRLMDQVLISRPGLMLCQNPKEDEDTINETYYYVSQSATDPGNSQFLDLYNLKNRPFTLILRGKREFLKFYDIMRSIDPGKIHEKPQNMFIYYTDIADLTASKSLNLRSLGNTGFHPGIYDDPKDINVELNELHKEICETYEKNCLEGPNRLDLKGDLLKTVHPINVFGVPETNDSRVPIQR